MSQIYSEATNGKVTGLTYFSMASHEKREPVKLVPLKCEGCGAANFEQYYGVAVCRYCGREIIWED